MAKDKSAPLPLLAPPSLLSRSYSRSPSPSSSPSPSLASSEMRDERHSISSSTYRLEVLEPNSLHYVNSGALPPRVRSQVDNIINAPRKSLYLSNRAAKKLATKAQDLVDSDEATFTRQFVDELAPRADHYRHSRVTRKLPFYTHTTPRKMTATVAPVQPKPDISYGYDNHSFSSFQRHANETQAYQYTEISSNSCLPFFIWEIKTQATGGNVYQAVNQCITGGSTIVKAALLLERLIRRPSDAPPERVPKGAIAFSVAIDSTVAQLNVHWYSDGSAGSAGYYTQRVNTFSLVNPQDLADLKLQAANILEWGYRDRFDTVSKHLTDLYADKCQRPDPDASDSNKRPLDHELSIILYDTMQRDYEKWRCDKQSGRTSISTPIIQSSDILVQPRSGNRKRQRMGPSK